MIVGNLNQQRLKPKVLVENKISFAAAGSELSIYDTFEQADKVKLVSDQLLFCGMVTGKKVMHADDENFHNEFLPHESFVMAPNKIVEIDFPDARIDAPTTCLAIEISQKRIVSVLDSLNFKSPLANNFGDWEYRGQLVHTHHNSETQSLLNRIVKIYCENHPDRSFMVDLAISELIARLLRHQTRDFIISFSQQEPDNNGLNAATSHIINNLQTPIDIDKLCSLSCMGRTKFFNEFRKHLGCTPSAFLNQMRLKKAAALIASGFQITQSCFEVGFTNTSHFSRSFRHHFGMTPLQYQKRKPN